MGSQGKTGARENVWTPANIVTVIRICFVPLFVIAILAPWPEWVTIWSAAAVWKPWIAAAIFTLLAATDGVDGYLARSRNEVTDFGKFIDPLADKILVTAALLVLIELGVLPSWIALIILAREFIVSGIRMMAATKGVVIAASWYGKAKTVTQIIAIIMFIIKDSVLISDTASILVFPLFVVSWIVMIAAVILTIGSMLDYFVKAKDLLGFGRGSNEAEAASAPNKEAEGVEGDLANIASSHVQSIDDLAKSVVYLAIEKDMKICAAESLTGGLISAALTSVSGSSAVVRGGVVSYASEVKKEVLRVSEETLEKDGVVSAQTASQMAEGALEQLDADISVAVTGIAGPFGDGSDTPVGTVWIAVSVKEFTEARVYHFAGSRSEVRELTVREALSSLLRVLSQ